MSGVWGWGGWVVVMLLPFSFWVLIVAFMVILFGRTAPLENAVPAEEMAAVEVDEIVVDPVRDTPAASGGLGWRPPVPSHH